jgi:hypothetical protein
MSDRHPSESDLALLAGGDCAWWQGLRLRRHVTRCGDCRDALASFSELRSAVRESDLPGFAANDPAWDRMASEMRANIRLGLAAGECVGEAPVAEDDVPHRAWVPRFAIGMASVVLLAGAGIFLRSLLPHGDLPGVAHSAVVESSGTGVEVRTDSGSMTLLNHGDEAGNQTVTSQGAVQTSSIDGNTGTVTITSVYVE